MKYSNLFIKETTFSIDYDDFENLIRDEYGVKEYDFVADIEGGNDSTYKYDTKIGDISKWDEKRLNEFITKGKYSFLASTLFHDLCRRELLEYGTYTVEVCW